MREPKFKLGAAVKVTLQYTEATLGLKVKLETPGTIIGVSFDPQLGGGPHYHYTLLFSGGKSMAFLEGNIREQS